MSDVGSSQNIKSSSLVQMILGSDEIDRYDALVVTGEPDSGREGLQLALRR
jgi:hypothetical protein